MLIILFVYLLSKLKTLKFKQNGKQIRINIQCRI
jgi:hypothetical protein